MDSSREAYAAGSVGFADLIDSQRTLLEVRQMIAESHRTRETTGGTGGAGGSGCGNLGKETRSSKPE
jgi:hypothetical protein